MNLHRALAGLFSSSAQARKWLLLRPVTTLQSSPLSTDAAAKRTYRKSPKPPPSQTEQEEDLGLQQKLPPQKGPPELPKPSEIPWQARVANSVRLIGSVGVPVQLAASQDGTYTAVSVLVNEKTHDLPQLWIPLIFQGDLAQIAACHLKENDVVYVTGQLSGDAPPLTIKKAEVSIQVLVDSISFVQNIYSKIKEHTVVEQDVGSFNSSADMKDNGSTVHLWNDLLANPHKWCDNRSNKTNPAFKHEDTGELLLVNESTPEWVLSKLDMLIIGQTPKKSHKIASTKKTGELVESPWNDLVENPHRWWDNRTDKLNGNVKPKYPDFRHKDTQQGIWLNDAPDWVLSKLGGSVSDTKSGSLKQEKYMTEPSKKQKNDESWKSLVENPGNWWDNRADKLKPSYPDFKHKDTGEALWIVSSTTPPWVLPKLPPVKFNRKAAAGFKGATLLS